MCIPIDTFLEFFTIPEVIKEMQALMNKLHLGIFFIVTSYKDAETDEFRKEVLLFSDSNIMDDSISKYTELRDLLSVEKNYKLRNMQQRCEETKEEDLSLITWDVGNIAMSRKDLEQILKVFYPYKIYSDFIQDGFSTETMKWIYEPGSWQTSFDADATPETEGYGGHWQILEDGQKLSLRPDSKKDYWRRTYYTPLLIKNDGPCFLRKVPASMLLTMEVYFNITPFR